MSVDSTATVDAPTLHPCAKRLTPQQRVAVVAEVASGKSIGNVAKAFNVSRTSISNLVNACRKAVTGTALDSQATTIQQISRDSKVAIHRSVLDKNDVHKAAGTGLSWLKGTGELAGDTGVTNVFITQIQQLPKDWQGQYASLDDDVKDVTPPEE